MVCLITGAELPIQRTHSPIKGVWHAKTTGADIVSFNARAYESYGKEKRQGENAPISEAAAFAYTTALNHLLDRNSRQKVQIGDASTIFWAQMGAPDMENGFAALFGDIDDPDARIEYLRALFNAIHNGQFDGGRGTEYFYVLGLAAPSKARLSIRYWYAAPLYEIAIRIRQWFDDLKMVRGPRDPEYPALFLRSKPSLLSACAVQQKADNVPPNLGNDIMRAILTGGPYPISWLNAAVQRCRAEQSVTYLRAAALKAYFNRSRRCPDSSFVQEFFDMLDTANTNQAYRLGRLFAILEKVQERAINPGSTIRERYYGAASSTPAAVFATLFRLKNHHLAKLGNREGAFFERVIGEIVDGLDDFPAHLNLQDQGRFALGYYHQRNFRKIESESAQSDETIQGESKCA